MEVPQKIKVINITLDTQQNFVQSPEKTLKQLLNFLFLNTTFVYLLNLNPPSLIVIPKKEEEFFKNFLEYTFENFKFFNFYISYRYIDIQIYEQMVIDMTEDIELEDFVITPRTGERSKIPLYIRSLNFAQGTGAHPTTKLMLNNLKSMLEKFKNHETLIIDYGSGSGILSIASQKIVPHSTIIPIEISFKSLKESLTNFKMNKLEILPILASNPYVLNLQKLRKGFSKTVFLANLPLNVLEICFKYFKNENYFFEAILISGIKKSLNFANEEFIKKLNKENFSNYLEKYNIQYNTLENWLLIKGEIDL